MNSSIQRAWARHPALQFSGAVHEWLLVVAWMYPRPHY
jgi:hypothetical protein